MVAWLLWSAACQFTVIDWPTLAVVGAVTEVAARSTACGRGILDVQAGGTERLGEERAQAAESC